MLRLLRTAILAAACTGLAWGGHHLWATAPASAGGFVAATAVLSPLLWYFTRLMRGFGDIFAVMAVAQILLHLVFQASSEPVLAASGGHGVHGPLSHALGFAPGMLLAHLWAALLAAALLSRGEAALWFLASLFLRALPPPHAPDLAFGVPVRTWDTTPAAPPSPVALSARCPRGPPPRARSFRGSSVSGPALAARGARRRTAPVLV